MNLNSVLRIAAQVTGLQDLDKLEKGLQGAEKAARSAKDGFKAMLDSSAFQAAAVAAAGLGVAIGLSAKAAISFEESMADVRKVVDGLESPKALAEMRQEIINMSKTSPLLAKDFADIFAAAGQAGIAKNDIAEFAKGVEQIAIAFDMTAEEAGTAFAKLRATLGLTTPEMMDLADAINHLSNNTASTAPQIVDFMKRVAATGQAAGLSAEQTAAFGSAMIAGGAEAEVAATSFRRMVSAIAAGPNATEKQIGVLQQLGYVIGNTADEERYLTQAIEDESRRRIDAARQETDERLKEVSRYFRDRLTEEQDLEDDEMDIVTKRIRRRMDAEIKAARDRKASEEYLNTIRDKYDEELKLERRASRDRMTTIRDSLDDQRDVIAENLKQQFAEQEKYEEERKKMLIQKAKEATAEAGAQAAKQLAANLQKDAIGTITDLFERLRALPKEAQLSAVTGFFGEEARALMPLIQNADLLEKSLGLVADKNNYAGSSLKEMMARMATTAAEIEKARGAIDNLAIAFGSNFAPAITAVLNALGPVVDAFTWLITNVPLLGPLLAIVTSAFVGLIAVAPFISGLITLMGQLGISTAAIAGIITVVQVAFSGLVSFLMGTILPAIIAFFSGPVGWITLAVAAVVALAYAFREPLGQMLNAIGDFCGRALSAFNNALIKPLAQAWEKAVKFLGDALQGVGRFIVSIWDNIITGMKNAVRYGLQHIANMINAVSRLVNILISAFNRLPGPDIPMIPQITVPGFAEGGVVNGPTLAVVGEGGQREYIVPESKAAGFASNYLMGARGAAALPGFAQGGVVNGGANIGNTSINVTTGPVLQQDGKRYVTMNDLEQALNTVTASLLGNNRSAGGRRFQGV